MKARVPGLHVTVNVQSVTRASLLLSVVLLGAFAYRCYRPPRPSGVWTVPESQAQPDAAAQSSTEPGGTANQPGAGETASQGDWSQIESPDYATYMANLRAVGCPEEVIRDIITAKVNKRYQERAAAVYNAMRGPFSFWATDQTRPTPSASADLADQLAQCERDRQGVLTQLGVAAGPDQAQFTTQQIERERRVAFLPPAKQHELALLEDQYSEVDGQIHAIVDVRSSITDPEALEQVLDRYAQRKAALSQLLSPEEYEQYELSTSWTADNLRRKLAGFAPTEEEFRGIFRLWRAHDEALATIYALHQPEPGNLYVFEGIKQLLGEERNAQYRQAWPGAPVPPASETGAVEGVAPQPTP